MAQNPLLSVIYKQPLILILIIRGQDIFSIRKKKRRKHNKLSQQRHKTIKVMSQVDGTIMWLFCNIVFAAAFLPSSKSLNISPLLCLGQYYILLSCFLLDKGRCILFSPSSTSC